MTRGLRALSVALLVASGLALGGCASFRTMTAGSADLEDYRSFRVAAAEGMRLRRAKDYLGRHPEGRFADEVRAAFAEEEPRYFEAAQGSREAARRYLVDLPDGPHAEAAFALLTALESSMAEAELVDIARRVRFQDAQLEEAAVQRRAVGAAILDAVGTLLDDDVYGERRSDAPPALRTLLAGRVESTWGALPARREEDLFFLLPTRPERESRLLTLEIALAEEEGRIVGASVEGSDMFVRWLEADRIMKVDPLLDRTEAQVYAMDRLSGALERRFPAARCRDMARGRELVHRACDGWEVVIVAGENAGDKDSIAIRGPARKASSR